MGRRGFIQKVNEWRKMEISFLIVRKGMNNVRVGMLTILQVKICL